MSPEKDMNVTHFISSNLSDIDLGNLSLEQLNNLLRESQPATAVARHRVWPYFFWLTFVVGMLGNWLVVYILLRKKNLRTVTNLYLLNLAIGDILYLVTTLPHTIYWTDVWPIGQAMCMIIHYLMGVSMTVSVLSLTAVGLDRHYAILYPVSSRQHRTLPKTATVIIIFWIFSFLVSSPSFVIARKIDYGTGKACLNYWKLPWAHRVHSLVIFIVLYVIPQCILAVCYVRIGKRLWFSMRLHGKDNSRSVQTLRTRRRVVKMVIIATLCFAICWLPIHLVELYLAYGKNFGGSMFYEMKLLAPLVPHLFIATNPIMYCFMSKTFLMSFKNAFACHNNLLTNSYIDDRDLTSSRKNEKNNWNRTKEGSDLSNEASNHERNENVLSVDKCVNTSPRLQKQTRQRSDTQTSSASIDGQKIDASATIKYSTKSFYKTSVNL